MPILCTILTPRTRAPSRIFPRQATVGAALPAGDKVAFVRENNIFISDLATGDEIQVTTTG